MRATPPVSSASPGLARVPGTGHAPDPSDVALLLHTSGTTSRPKLVPLTHRQLCRLGPQRRRDAAAHRRRPVPERHAALPHPRPRRGAARLARRAAARSCAPRLRPGAVLRVARRARADLVHGRPDDARGVLARARAPEQVAPRATGCGSSARRRPRSRVRVLEGLEAAVRRARDRGLRHDRGRAPDGVATRCRPAVRKPGTVGIGCRTGDRDPRRDGQRAARPGEVGEVAIRGASVFGGYEDNPEANAAAFVDGWFRTGDEGSLDEDGYLTLRGRIKEIINRGGEKISPLEVDEALLAPPGRRAGGHVRDRRRPARRGGRRGGRARRRRRPRPSASSRTSSAQQLAPFKVPRRILVVDEIPKGPTGKVQRIGLAERLGVDEPPASRDADRAAVELPRAASWSRSGSRCSTCRGVGVERRLLRARRRLDPRRRGGRPRSGT